jgi:hypothetical protein
MGGKRRDRDRKPARRKPFKEPKPLILIVCEGENTEPQYFDAFVKSCKNPRVRIHLHDETGVPLTLVRIAKEAKAEAQRKAKREGDDFLKYDSVWCVFDVDEHPNIPDAMTMATDNGIELSISSPCFELWLFLHFQDSPGVMHRHKLQKSMEKLIPEYDKRVDYSDYEAGYSDAVRRAKKLTEQAERVGDPIYNPSTGVYRLTEMIRGG